jgi:hypothetical protein
MNATTEGAGNALPFSTDGPDGATSGAGQHDGPAVAFPL